MTLTQEQKDFYSANGYLSPVAVCEPGMAERYQQEFNSLEGALGREKCADAHRMTGRFIFDEPFGRRFVWDIVSNPVLLDVVEGILGSFHLLSNTTFFCRYGNDSDRYVAWHQDLTYMQMEPAELVTAWFAIDDADEGNGAVQVVPGSHLGRDFYRHGESAGGGNILNRNQEVLLDSALRSKAVSLPLRRGEAAIFSGFLLHGSPPNRSDRRRCGLSIRYAPVHAKSHHPKISLAIHMRGEDPFRYYEQRARPFQEGTA